MQANPCIIDSKTTKDSLNKGKNKGGIARYFYVFSLSTQKKLQKVCRFKIKQYLCTRNRETIDAQMAESVDALVSNTSGFTSIPVRPRVWVQQEKDVLK